MRARARLAMMVLAASGAGAGAGGWAAAQTPPAASQADAKRADQPPAPPGIVDQLRAEAAALEPLAGFDLTRRFLRATAALPLPEPRTVLRTKDRSAAYTPEQAAGLPESVRGALTEKTYDARFYYTTGYGSPLVYARVVDLIAAHGEPSLAGAKLLDFGYGTVGHVRLLASLGCEAHGVDVEPVFGALYARPEDQGEIASGDHGPAGRIALHRGRWPAERSVVREIGSGYDVITSKNTLKRGYIHPARPTDPRMLVRLGVDDGTFLRHVHDALKPGGLFIIYNIAPAQNPPDKPYIPWADGQCPFTREQLQNAGLEIVEFDREDRATVLDYWMALGINQGKSREETGKDLFAWYTVCRRPR